MKGWKLTLLSLEFSDSLWNEDFCPQWPEIQPIKISQTVEVKSFRWSLVGKLLEGEMLIGTIPKIPYQIQCKGIIKPKSLSDVLYIKMAISTGTLSYECGQYWYAVF